MFRVSTGAALGLRASVVFLASVFALVTLCSSTADARGKRKTYKRTVASSSVYQPRYADIVVDANTGDVLHSTQPDALRHPASLTKIMTLYLLFERLESGKIRLDTPLEVSAHASRQAPTKLGLRPGQTITVEDAIKGLVTKSANDAAVVVAEALAGSEDEFAKLMTRKARSLRMSRTIYKNASGLPDSDQVTTARDQALLGLAIQDRFPRYYSYFSLRSFTFRGKRLTNHNRLLGRVNGVHGIKTGYTRASGFNLVSAVQRGERRLVAVVLGGASAGARDAKMRSLIDQKIALASVRRTAPKIVEIAEAAPAERPVRAAPAKVTQAPVRVASSAPLPLHKDATLARAETEKAQAASDRPEPGSTDPIKPLLVKTLSVKSAAQRPTAPMTLLSPESIATRVPAEETAAAPRQELPPPPVGARPGVLGVLPAKDVPTRTASISPVPAPAAAAKPEKSERLERPEKSTRSKTDADLPVSAAPRARSGWIVQVGAFEEQDEAKEKLAAAKSQVPALLRDAEPYTEIFAKGDKRYFRARFAGLKESAAEQVCRQLKKSKIACFTVRQ